MSKKIYNILIISSLLLLITACKTDPLENYFVQATESPDYFVVNIPASIVSFDEDKLDSKTLKDLHSIKKMNVLVYKNNFEPAKKQSEFEKAHKIINSKHYKTLTKINNKGYEVVFSYQGQPTGINELIFLGKDKDYNFVIGMLKGKDVNVNSIAKALKHIKAVDKSQTESIIEILKPNIESKDNK